MALCKELAKIGPSTSAAFDQVIRPGTEVRYEGIYRCVTCPLEVVAVGGRPFPSQSRHPGTDGCTEHRWQLLVAATPYEAKE